MEISGPGALASQPAPALPLISGNPTKEIRPRALQNHRETHKLLGLAKSIAKPGRKQKHTTKTTKRSQRSGLWALDQTASPDLCELLGFFCFFLLFFPMVLLWFGPGPLGFLSFFVFPMILLSFGQGPLFFVFSCFLKVFFNYISPATGLPRLLTTPQDYSSYILEAKVISYKIRYSWLDNFAYNWFTCKTHAPQRAFLMIYNLYITFNR